MNVLASANAIRLIDKYCYESPKDLNLEELLYAENLKLKEDNLEDCEGRIVFNEEMGIITVDNKSIDTQKRFTIAHEMGHFFNEKLEIRNDKLGETLRDAQSDLKNDKLDPPSGRAGGQIWNEKFKVINDKLNSLMIDNDTALSQLDKEREKREANQYFNEKALTTHQGGINLPPFCQARLIWK